MSESFRPVPQVPCQHPVGVIYQDPRVFTAFKKDDSNRPYVVTLFSVTFFDGTQPVTLVRYRPVGGTHDFWDEFLTITEKCDIINPSP
jgi:hypothetical protein